MKEEKSILLFCSPLDAERKVMLVMNGNGADNEQIFSYGRTQNSQTRAVQTNTHLHKIDIQRILTLEQALRFECDSIWVYCTDGVLCV